MSISPRFRELVRHFLMRFYDNDLLSPDSDQLPGLASALGVLAAPGIIIPLWLLLKYSLLGFYPIAVRDLSSMIEKHLFVGLSMTTIGCVAVLQWDALFPDRRDYMVLCPLPLRFQTILAAKICSLFVVFGVLLGTVTSFTPVLFPAAVLEAAPFSTYIRFGACHLLAVSLASLFALFSVIGIQGLFLNALPYRVFRRISPWLQLSCLIGLVLQFLFSMRAFSLLNYRQVDNDWTVYASPPLWFLGLYQYGQGWHNPVFRDLTHIALTALTISAGLAVVCYALAYGRHARRCLETASAPVGAPGLLRRTCAGLLNTAVLRHPLERAVFRFMTATIARSRKQRLYVIAYAGLALAASFNMVSTALAIPKHSWLHRPGHLLVFIPFILLFVLLPGLRHVYAIPAELKANWVFRLSLPTHQQHIVHSIRTATLLLGILTIYIGLFPIYLWLWGPTNAILHTAFGISVGLVLREILLFDFQKIPFTCSYVPRRSNVKACIALYVISGGTLIYGLTRIELYMLRRAWLLALPLGIAGLAICLGAVYRRRTAAPFLFDDQPDPAVQELGLC